MNTLSVFNSKIGKLDADMKRYSQADTVKAAWVIGGYMMRNELTQVR